MSHPPTYFARIHGEVRGPFTPEQLRDFAEAGVIGRDSEVAGTRTGPWLNAGALPERETIFPPATEFAFKLASFEVLNPQDIAPAGVDDFIAAAQADGPVLRSQREKQAALERELAKPVAPLNDVQAMVNAVNADETQFAPPPPPRRKWKPSARLKIVLTLAVLGNAVLATLPFAYDAFGDYVSMLGFKAWFVIYNGALVITYTTMPKD